MNIANRDDFPQCWSKLFSGLGMCQQLGDELKDEYLFLQNLTPLPETIVNFGCSAKWDSFVGFEGGLEPFALLWTLKAKKVVVVDISEDSIDTLRKHVNELTVNYPQCFEYGTNSFEYLVADMTNPKEMSQLSPQQFELAYCSRVLLNIEHGSGLGAVRTAIAEISRVVKPEGLIVSHEADACNPYPSKYVDIFSEQGFYKAEIIRQPESISMPGLQIEYAIFKRLPNTG